MKNFMYARDKTKIDILSGERAYVISGWVILAVEPSSSSSTTCREGFDVVESLCLRCIEKYIQPKLSEYV